MIFRIALWWVRRKKKGASFADYVNILYRYERMFVWESAERVPIAIEIFKYFFGFFWLPILLFIPWYEALFLINTFLDTESFEFPGLVGTEQDYEYPGHNAGHLLYLVTSSGGNPREMSIQEGLLLAAEATLQKLRDFEFSWYLSERTISYDKNGNGKAIEFPVRVVSKTKRFHDVIYSVVDKEMSEEDATKGLESHDPLLSKKDRSS